MNVELINTGSELLLGAVVNTHLAYFGNRLFPLGLRISRQVAVPDGPAITAALAEAFPRCSLLLVTGGLGPTTDDITREATAELLGIPLHPNKALQADLIEWLKAQGHPLQERLLRQTLVPEGATVLHNPYGTAPGLYIPQTARSPHLFLFPGPPRELQPMFESQALPILHSLCPESQAREQRIFRIVGMGESTIEERIGHQLSQDSRLEVGYCASPHEVDFRLIGPASVLEEVTPQIKKKLGETIASQSGETLEQVVVTQLHTLGQTLACAESCTGGLLAHRITNVPGAAGVFLQGWVTYTSGAKQNTLGLSSQVLELEGAVSEMVARQMALRARELSGADHALSLTGLAGPGSGSEDAPVGTLYLALASAAAPTLIEKKLLLTDRETFKLLASQAALDLLRRRLLEG